MSDYAEWIGRAIERSEPVTERMIEHFRVTLAGTRASLDVLPGFHWCLAPDAVEPQDFGRDGHPRTGIFLPALPLPRRMWAGGEVVWHGNLAQGEIVKRISTIRDVTFKQGRSGQLGFVTVDHAYEVDGEVRISDRQDIVYRDDPKPGAAPAAAPAEVWQALRSWRITPTPTLLFRYSALTFNGHRIHYDQPYVTKVEGYDGLVVHGPLQSTWMQNLATDILGRLPASFAYRGLSPLTVGRPVTVEAREVEGGLEMRVRRDEDGVVTMQGMITA
ncbi:HTD2 family dehydratase [Stappia sp. ICDLI1TA098]